MKESYKYDNGMVYVSDNKQGLLEYKYQDNIVKILKCENDIEEIKRILEEENCKIRDNNIKIVKNPFYTHRVKIFFSILITLLVNIYFFNIAPSLFIRIINLSCLIPVGLSIPFAYLMSDFENNKTIRKNINSSLLKKEKFEDLLKEKEKILNDLKKDNNRILESKNDKNIKKIDVIKDLQDIYILDYVYTECGYNLEKIIDLYKKGQLDSWISCLTDLGERNLVKKIVKQIATEDGPRLIKKYNKNYK